MTGAYTAPVYNIVSNPSNATTTPFTTVKGAVEQLSSAVQTPLTFTGNTGTTNRKLGQTLAITGSGNLNTVSSNDGIAISMSDTPTFSKVSVTAAPLQGTDATNKTYVDGTRTLVTSNNSSIKVTETASGNAKSFDLAINAQGLSESAQLPVVYTNAAGAKLYKQADGTFNTADDGTGDTVAANNIIASIQSANGSTTTATKLSNVAAGSIAANSTDAVNGSQLNTTNTRVANNTTVLGGSYDAVTGAYTAPVYNVQGGKQSNVGDALSALDGAINDINNVNQSISDAAIQYDKNTNGTINKDSITLGGGTNGTTITNVKGGALTAGSTDAVNGGQLFATNQQVSQNTSDIGNLKNEINNGSVGLVKQDSDNNITVAANKGGTSISMAGTEGDRTISGVKAGAVNATSSEAINGAQLNAANTTMANILGGGSKVDDKGNVTAPSYEIAGDKYNDVGSALKAADVASLTRFDSLNNRIDEAFGYTNDRIDSVERQASAGIAAALSLESAPYIPGKFTYSIGAGYHRGENAIGGSLRRTADSGRWSITGGVATDSEGGASGRIGLSGVIN